MYLTRSNNFNLRFMLYIDTYKNPYDKVQSPKCMTVGIKVCGDLNKMINKYVTYVFLNQYI